MTETPDLSIDIERSRERRWRAPWWALAALALMPIWAFMYARALTGTAEASDGPLGLGATVYASNCATCHGATGGGVAGSGYPFDDGAALLTFPRIDDQLRFVYHGTDAYRIAGIDVYGDPERPGGAHLTGARNSMPPFGTNAGGSLTDAELVAVVCHERYTLGVIDPRSELTGDEFDLWCSAESPPVAQLADITDAVRAPDSSG